MPRTRTLVYTNAGHPSGYILDASGQVKHRLESTGVPLGVLEGCDFPTQGPIPLETGDLILFVTDGLIDASPTGKVIFGTHRILDVVRAHQHEPAAAIVAALHQSVRDFAQRATLDDDVTAMVVKVLPTRG
jgi:sigma-B regulation protein RsbU (phosphoserine phosphatase)